MTLDECRDKLKQFLSRNPSSSVAKQGENFIVTSPWADDSLIISLDDDSVFEALNSVYLPERFSALWHPDSESMEMIWTAYKTTSEVRDRKFCFRFDDENYECFFGPSSPRLVSIGENALPAKQSDTDYRNLLSFFFRKESDQAAGRVVEPRSFWITPVKWDEDKVVRLARNINFYLSYFDVYSPLIVLHTPKSEDKAVKPRLRYIDGSFPAIIDGRALDDDLLHFWSASLLGDPARRFIYCFRIIEYASFSYLEQKTRVAVRRVLASPNLSSRLDDSVTQIVTHVESMKIDDAARMSHSIGDAVDVALVWKEISQNLNAFTTETFFDGGFKISPLIKQKSDFEASFRNDWPGNFSKHIRDIRNALSHGREKRTLYPITPTVANFERLRPWAALIHIAAGQLWFIKVFYSIFYVCPYIIGSVIQKRHE